ncbi:MAG: hypothetical protein D6781_11725 [Verrucomicrobia bacterium]|nr:MAG: hypothetical protein D6781_11725 [Verrucomicrobiota bacterium]
MAALLAPRREFTPALVRVRRRTGPVTSRVFCDCTIFRANRRALPLLATPMQSIGERLEEARKRKGVSIREASEATKIRGEFLLGFENNQFDIGLPEIYVRGFLRNYAVFLKLDADKIVTDFNARLIGEVKAARREPRELFGRMEIPEKHRSAEASTASREARAPGDADAGDEGDEGQSATAAAPRLQLTPEMLNYIKIGAIVVAGIVAILVIVWMIQAIVRVATSPSDEAPAPAQQTAPAASATTEQQAPQEIITLIALDDVRVKVTQAADGKELFDGPLARGETRQIAKRGRVLITYDKGRNLNVEKDGRRFRMPIEGIGRSSFE